MSARKSTYFTAAGFLLSTCLAVILLELALRVGYPQETLYPRWAFSPQYCFTVYPDVRMVHERPGRWRFVYTTNRDQYRGPRVRVDPLGKKPTVVVLGDSYSFGAGVNDGEEYSAVLERDLKGAGQVVNLGIGGWGLTQEIRRYYDFGIRFRPRVVILQFSANDPRDNLRCPVAIVRDRRFEFHDSHEGIYRIKEILSRSWIQKSQIYNLLRDRLYRLAESPVVERERQRVGGGSALTAEERVYVQLLDCFASDLSTQGVRLVFLSVNGQLRDFPHIAAKVTELQAKSLLRYVDAADWLKNETDYASPEGHLWGARAHRILGERLASLLRDELVSGRPGSGKP